jgi:hypothetical protein
MELNPDIESSKIILQRAKCISMDQTGVSYHTDSKRSVKGN